MQVDGGSVKMWEYEEAALTLEEYGEYEKLVAEADSPAMEKLRQDNATLMQAVADLYETQTAMQEIIMLGLADIYEQNITA